MRYTMAVTSIITTTGSMTVEADTPEAAQEQVEAVLKYAWRHAPSAWQAGIDLLNDAYTAHSSPYTFFLLNGDMELYRNRHFFI